LYKGRSRNSRQKGLGFVERACVWIFREREEIRLGFVEREREDESK